MNQLNPVLIEDFNEIKSPSSLQYSPDEKSSTTIVKDKKIGRNDPCPCGSGKKYKYCCGRNK